MRKIICRFDNQEDIDRLSKKNEKISIHIKELNLDTNMEIRRKKVNKKDSFKDRHDCDTHYVNMPEFESKQIEAFHTIKFYTTKTSKELSELFDQSITDQTKSIWFPRKGNYETTACRVLDGSLSNKYPMYVVSKGRAEICSTSVHLSLMGINHYVVVEPQEVDIYEKNLDLNTATVLELDMTYKENYDTFSDLGNINSTGPGAARNFCWDHSIDNGHKWHWVFDDNTVEGFFWLYQNRKIKLRTPAFFRAIENFVGRYDNIAIGGLNYSMFCSAITKYPPYVSNTRIYSYLLIRNDIPYRWRGRYNEDTDLSLNVLKDGWCTVQFNSMLAGKINTQSLTGGNTDEFYSQEGTKNKSQMLVDMHPDVARMVWKYDRWHHYINYSIYKQKFKLKPGINLDDYPKVNNYGMKIIMTEEDTTKNSREFLEDKYRNEIDNYTHPRYNDYTEKEIEDPFKDFYI